MTELHIKIEPAFAREFKEISRNAFNGNESLAFQEAVKLLRVLQSGNPFENFWRIAEQIRKKVDDAGGVSDKDIDNFVRKARAKHRHASGK